MFGFAHRDGAGGSTSRRRCMTTKEPEESLLVTDEKQPRKIFLSPLVSEESDMDLLLTFLPCGDSNGSNSVNDSKGRSRSRSSKDISPSNNKSVSNLFAPFQLNQSEVKLRSGRRGRASSSRSSSSSMNNVSSAEQTLNRFRPSIEYAVISNTFAEIVGGKSYTEEMQGNGIENVDVTKMVETLQWAIHTAPKIFWNKFSTGATEDNDEWKRFNAVYLASSALAETFVAYTSSSGCQKGAAHFRGYQFDAFTFVCDNIPGILMSTVVKEMSDPGKIDQIFDTFYTCGFKAMNCVGEKRLLGENLVGGARSKGGCQDECDVCKEDVCVCPKIVEVFQQANKALQGLGLMKELVGPRIHAVISREMALRVDETCSGKFEASHIDDLKDWLTHHVLPWVDVVYPDCNSNRTRSGRDEFSQLLMEVYGKAIISEMFSVIIEFPDSQPMLEDLRACMRQANLRDILVTKLKWALERRLLNAGVSTNSVLDAYCNCVKALKFVDASGILVQLITPPVRDYLKHREETVRVILVSLTEESGDLAEELSRNPSHSERKARLCSSTWTEWKPDPIDVPRDKFNLRKSDLIQALVSIYGSKTLFIDEYRALLADRLLRMPKPGPITREIKCLELLKLRFGDSNLQKCEVMLKDVSDSQRLNTRFYEDEGAVLADEDFVVTGLIVSAQFWPSFKPESLTLPDFVIKAFEKYTKAFEAIKGNRTLEWHNHVGTVEIEIEHGGRTLEFTCTPSQAVIMHQFSVEESWPEEKLAEACGISVAVLRARIGFWTSKGIISENPKGSFCLCNSFTEVGSSQQNAGKYLEETETDFPLTSTSTQRENDLQTFWSYIEGMLTNLESLPLARIHAMLKLFATVECSIESLQKFLDEKVSQNLLAYSGGQYQLPK